MPIKKANRRKYPPNWGKIRMGILERAKGRCEQCGVPDRAWGYRDADGAFHVTARADPDGNMDWIADPLTIEQAEIDGKVKTIQIVLTIAHLDHDPTNNDPDNLRALCQKDHFAHDREDNARKRAEMRRGKTGNLELFGKEGD